MQARLFAYNMSIDADIVDAIDAITALRLNTDVSAVALASPCEI